MGLLKAISREYSTLNTFRGLQKWTKELGPDRALTVADDLEAVVDAHGRRIAFRYEGAVATYNEFDARANQFAHWALSEGLRGGDVVALFMENRPDYIAAWYGLSKVGVISSLINTNLTGEGLAHCINESNACLVLTGAEQDAAIASAAAHLDAEMPLWTLGGSEGKNLEADLAQQSPERPDRSLRAHLRGRDDCLYVFTSGTTGLPKAAKLNQARLANMMRSFIAPCQVTEKDRVYVTLPLYHATGGVCAVGIALMTGATVVLRRKFSASRFWDDCDQEGVTVISYIGELCRYLLNQPPHPKEREHRIRTGFGNGLRPDIWQAFSNRFGIPKLIEFYASTEGNVRLMNVDGKVGAVGRIPSYLKFAFDHIAFAKFDPVSELPQRDENGFCIPADFNEPAEVLGRIGTDLRSSFEGYKDPSDSERKILRNVFEPGDAWFRTGDLMTKDEDGYVYFIDRIGDTFRWKGENVAASEVAAALTAVEGVLTANVYGVPVSGADGKAGMAALTVSDDLNFETLAETLSRDLPPYALPRFLRVQREAETTGTFKYRKVDLVADGFDPAQIRDPLWVLVPAESRYTLLTKDLFADIESGALQL